jgi:hypothetical protein
MFHPKIIRSSLSPAAPVFLDLIEPLVRLLTGLLRTRYALRELVNAHGIDFNEVTRPLK